MATKTHLKIKIPKKAVIIACDFSNKKLLYNFLDNFPNKKLFLKLGMEILYAEGFNLITKLSKLGHYIFVDLKMFDIPNTVIKAIEVLNNYPIAFLTVHGTGSKKMLIESVKHAKTMKIIAVSALTSLSKEEFQSNYLTKTDIKDFVKHILNKAVEAKIYGVVCSVKEAKILKPQYPDIAFICPGIRDSKKLNSKDDQSRVASVIEAKKANIDYIVVGRPITESNDPLKKYKMYCKEFLK